MMFLGVARVIVLAMHSLVPGQRQSVLAGWHKDMRMFDTAHRGISEVHRNAGCHRPRLAAKQAKDVVEPIKSTMLSHFYRSDTIFLPLSDKVSLFGSLP